ncbi:unnamed protein product [Brassica rapa subsp. trilocularis]
MFNGRREYVDVAKSLSSENADVACLVKRSCSFVYR